MNEIYFQELKKNKPLSDEQIKAIYKRVANGEQEALNEIITANLRFVVMIAKQYHNIIKADNIITLDDLICEGNIGLIEGVNKFKPELGFKLSTYIVIWIRKAIQTSIINNQYTLRIPAHHHLVRNKINKHFQIIEQEKGFVTIEDIKEINEFSDFYINQYFNPKFTISLDSAYTVVEDEKEKEFDEDDYIKGRIKTALKYLNPKEKQVIKMYYGIEKDKANMIGISEALKITRQRVSQIHASALEKLAEVFQNNNNN